MYWNAVAQVDELKRSCPSLLPSFVPRGYHDEALEMIAASEGGEHHTCTLPHADKHSPSLSIRTLSICEPSYRRELLNPCLFIACNCMRDTWGIVIWTLFHSVMSDETFHTYPAGSSSELMPDLLSSAAARAPHSCRICSAPGVPSTSASPHVGDGGGSGVLRFTALACADFKSKTVRIERGGVSA